MNLGTMGAGQDMSPMITDAPKQSAAAGQAHEAGALGLASNAGIISSMAQL
jgi:hypothetical protein